VPVSTTINPVTQTALVEVNKASRYEISSWVALGKINKSEPIKIITKKLAIKI
jgi:PIN domain nuclease of toxin-antitoxin system